jgi:hypothetical protein
MVSLITRFGGGFQAAVEWIRRFCKIDFRPPVEVTTGQAFSSEQLVDAASCCG